MCLRWPVMSPLCPGLPWATSQHVSTPRVYYNHLLKQKQNISFEIVAKKKSSDPSLSQWERHPDRLSHTATQSNNGLVEGKLNRRWQETNWGLEKRLIFSPDQKLGKVHLFTCVSQCLAGKAPLVKEAKFMEHSKKLEKRHVVCEANLSSVSPVIVFMPQFLEAPLRLCWRISHLQMERRERGRAKERKLQRETKDKQKETKRRKFSGV